MKENDVKDAVIDALEHSNSFELQIHESGRPNVVVVSSKNGSQMFEIKVNEIGKRR